MRKAMKVLITGSGGFVGRHLTEHLFASGDEVICSDISLGGPDLLDPDGLITLISDTKPDLVYHLAGQADVKESWENPLRTFRINAEGTLNLLLACQKSDVKKVLCVSSAEVYGQIQESEIPISEVRPINPTNPYATSKSAAELICQQFNSQGLEIMRARAFNHFGPGQRENFVAAALAKRMILAEQNGEPEIIVGNLEAIRDFTDVRDVVRAYRLILLKGEGGNVYNVCSGIGRRVQDLATTLLSFINSELKLKSEPELYRPADTPSIIGDYSKLHEQTGWKPNIEFEHTIKDIITSTRDILAEGK
jgi:GDP-4-dehydro-6-deoxy-D-mannose reductase|tara:strand:- start:29351 stop:30271 length:921 start_codon:yes stop_codon:yes gene_type:complete